MDIISTIRAGAAIYQVAALFLSDVYDEVGQVYVDMADSHLQSAQQAFRACEHSTDPESEIRSGLNHLRDSYNIYSKAIRKEVPRWALWWKHIYRPHFNDNTCHLAINIAALISLLYRELGELENANDWRAETAACYDFYIANCPMNADIFPIHSLDSLAAIDEDFVTEGLTMTTNYPVRLTEISDKGREYIRGELRKEKEKLLELVG